MSYILSGWQLKPDVPDGAKTLTTHRQSGQIALVGILLVGVVEGVAVHLLVGRWSPMVAFWIIVLSSDEMLFFTANVIATVKRPSYLTDSHFHSHTPENYNSQQEI
ncbi:hypothetical protein GO755_19950 [Spirosoma sp. HMF4905]|uniref:Uncharacterized protein n=1 Tax=Spirosoma arboris TaxID=2682092 RepID=A0A7K1SEX2_9BACT|nr:hypothetical protein [Spirosoma arboris]MVM32331.1 hypothetical protein [Spirosoma arboris]